MEEARSRRIKLWWTVAALGLAARFVLMLVSEGTNDVRIWDYFSHYIREHGLFQTYRDLYTGFHMPVPVFNHPPLSGLYMAGAGWVAEHLHVRFAYFVKLPGLVGELIAAWTLARIFRADPERQAQVVAAFAWSFCSILVAGFHGNTDCLYAGLMLLGIYLFETEKKPFLAGLALAAATNVKLIPIFIILPLLITTKEKKPWLRLVAGLSLGAVPFLIPLIGIPKEFMHNVVGYTPDPDFWGIEGLLMTSVYTPPFRESAQSLINAYLTDYRPFLFGGILLMAVMERLKPRLDNYQRSVLALTLFFILTPGFAVQYTAALAPLLFAVSLVWGMRYAVTAGLTIFSVYWAYKTPGYPLNSQFLGRFPFPAPMIGMLAWGNLIEFAYYLWAGKVARAATAPVHEDEAALEALATSPRGSPSPY